MCKRSAITCPVASDPFSCFNPSLFNVPSDGDAHDPAEFRRIDDSARFSVDKAAHVVIERQPILPEKRFLLFAGFVIRTIQRRKRSP